MTRARERWAIRLLSGEARGPISILLRLLLALVEPFYAMVAMLRNGFYRIGLFRSRKLDRPTIAVGNLTTGGTGKTPVVRLLADHLAERGLRPAVLMRGYKSKSTNGSDEQRMLASQLGSRGSVIANPDRVAGAATAIRESPQPSVFVLDDAFQHRKVRRDFNLLLISATNPFGYGHVLPRGLLREPIRGMKRADAIVLTRCNLVAPTTLKEIEQRVWRIVLKKGIPLYHANHVHAGLRDHQTGELRPMDELSERRFLLFTGIGDPKSLERQLAADFPETFCGTRSYPDHHAFHDGDLVSLRRAAAETGAQWLVTTEKDWVKVSPLITARDGLKIVSLELRLQFHGDEEQKLMKQIMSAIAPPAEAASNPPAASSETPAAPVETSAAAADAAASSET